MLFDTFQHEDLYEAKLDYLQTYFMGNHCIGAAWLRGKHRQKGPLRQV